MATWGEFIAEIPIINKRGEGIFVKVDHVLDLWEERNRLRAEVEKLQPPANGSETPTEPASVPLAAPVADKERSEAAAQERERCARELEEFADTCPVDPAWRELAGQLLRTAAQRLRETVNQQEIDFLAGVVIPPAPEAANGESSIPMAEPVSEETPPMAEPVYDEQIANEE